MIEAIAATVAAIAIGWMLLSSSCGSIDRRANWQEPPSALIPDLVRLVRGLLADGETPTSVRLALVGLLLYLLSPIDLVPDFMPVIGSARRPHRRCRRSRWVGRRVGLEDSQREVDGRPRRVRDAFGDFSACDLSAQQKRPPDFSFPNGRAHPAVS